MSFICIVSAETRVVTGYEGFKVHVYGETACIFLLTDIRIHNRLLQQLATKLSKE